MVSFSPVLIYKMLMLDFEHGGLNGIADDCRWGHSWLL